MSFTGAVVKPRRRNLFNMGNRRLSSMKMGYVYPIGVKWINPGDIWSGKTFAFVRTQPLKSPIFGRLVTEIWTKFIPMRLVWEDFEDFITGGPDGTSAPVVPWQAANTPAAGSLLDHLGIPPTCDHKYNVLPQRAYALCMNTEFIDPDLMTPIPMSTASGQDVTTPQDLQLACWKKDYLTSARPEPQKGADVLLPLGDEAPVILDPTNTTDPGLLREPDNTLKANADLHSNANSELVDNVGADILKYDPQGTLITDLSTATAVTIRQLRLASAVQKYRENMSIAGSRYYERLAQMGVRSQDARLQLPETVNYSRSVLSVSEVLQTSESGTTALGHMAGHGVGALKSRGFRKLFTEHGILLTIAVTRPEAIYADSLDRHYLYETKEEFWQPELEDIGQQEVWKSEVYAAGDAVKKETWGYQDRYDEDRRAEASVHGDFRTTLNYWHPARMFSSLPPLNDDFVMADVSVEAGRIFPAATTDYLYFNIVQKFKARRLLRGAAKRQLL